MSQQKTKFVENSAITNSKIADMAQSTIKGRASGAGTGAPVDLSATQATAILNTFTTSLQGLVPASGGGTTNFLRADGNFSAPTGTTSFPTSSLSVTGTTALVAGDSKKLIKITAQSGGYTITLPSHSADQVFWFKEVTNADVVSNPITIARNGGTGKIENVSASYVVRENNFSFGIYDDGTDWFIL